MLAELFRYRQGGAFEDGTNLGALVLPMGIGSVLGALVGGLLVPYVPAGALKVGLGAILILSAVRIFRAAPTDLTA